MEQVDESKFIGTIRVDIDSKEKSLEWLKNYEESTLTNFRKMNGKENTCRLVYKVGYYM